METFLLLVFASLAALTALLELSKRQRSKQETTNRDFVRFRNNYVLVYALMMGTLVRLPLWDLDQSLLHSQMLHKQQWEQCMGLCRW